MFRYVRAQALHRRQLEAIDPGEYCLPMLDRRKGRSSDVQPKLFRWCETRSIERDCTSQQDFVTEVGVDTSVNSRDVRSESAIGSYADPTWEFVQDRL